MTLTSPYWDETVGVCEKHGLPTLPCPVCVAADDPDIEIVLPATAHNVLDFDSSTLVEDMIPPTLATPGRTIRFANA